MTLRVIRAVNAVALGSARAERYRRMPPHRRRLAQTHGFDEEGVGKISIIATELATNLVRHGGGGEMLLQVLDDEMTPQFEIMAIDRGPGMRDVADCMRDGYSTAGTSGTGLGATSRLSTEFDLFSEPGKGTIVLSRVARRCSSDSTGSRRRPPPGVAPLEIGAVCVPLAGETECGDGWRVADNGQTVAMLVVDGLGHGPLAATAARSAAQAFEEQTHRGAGVGDAVSRSTPVRRPGRGGGLCAIACAGGKASLCGRGQYFGRHRRSAPFERPGVVEWHSRSAVCRGRQFDYDYSEDSVVVMHSDGLSARWHLTDYPGLCSKHAAVIAGVLFRDHARKRDDATVLVARHRS